MAVNLDVGINHKAFLRDVERGVKLANKRLASSASGLKLKIDEKSFRRPLGRITGDINMFDSALAASNARVIAFGASTAVIGGISKAFRELAKSTIEVEKAFVDINRILNMSRQNFEQFGNALFEIAKKNAASFQDATKGALEFARQGLSTAETLKRTADALTLVRLTGINADKAVASLTATVNAFDNAMVTTTTSVNKFVAVETKFAVGARDLVEAIGRVGSSAKDAKVGFDELNAMVTAVQQSTGRGGAVIGNAMKTIFTRLQRQSTLDALESYNVAVKDVEGNTLPAIQILNNFAQSYKGLTDNSQAYLREQVAGVFQANILSAVLRDLNKEQPKFAAALKVSKNATNEAEEATAKLNQTLSALATQTATEFKKLQENIGKQTFEPIARSIMEPLKAAMEGINELLDSEGVGGDIANGLLKGIKNVIGGPGLVAIGTVLFTVFKNTIGYMAQALPQLIGLTTETQKRATIEEFIVAALQKESDLALAVSGHEGDAAAQANLLAGYAEATAQDMERQATATKSMVTALMSVKGAGGNIAAAMQGGGGGKGAPRGASGFVPGIAGEIQDIRRGVGGVSPTSQAVSIPNFAFGGGVRGTMVANTGEYMVPNYRGGGSAIFNPQMVAQYGLPSGARPIRGAGGYVPNFVDVGKMRLADFEGIKPAALKAHPALMARFTALTGRTAKSLTTGMPDAMKAGYAKQSAQSKARRDTFISKQVAMLTPPSGIGTGSSSMHSFEAGNKIPGMKGRPFNVAFRKYTYNRKTASSSTKNVTPIEDHIENGIIAATRKFAASINPPAVDLNKPEMKAALNTAQGGAGAISSAAGAAFEVGISQALGLKAAQNEKGVKNLDVPRGLFTQQLKDLFSTGKFKVKPTITGGDFKIRDSKGNVKSMAQKIMSPAGDPAWPNWVAGIAARDRTQKGLTPRGARGYVPNFAAVGDAVEREIAAGVPLSNIRVGRSDRLSGPNNPAGIGITNTRDEPRGLKDVTGAARGYIPNFVDFSKITATDSFLGGRWAKILDAEQKKLVTAYKKQIADMKFQDMTEEQLKAAQNQLIATIKAQLTGKKLTKSAEDRLRGEIIKETTELAGSKPGGKGGMFAGMKGLVGKAGMGAGLGLSMGLPMLAGAMEQGGAGRKTTTALTGAGTGAALGMMFGPWGAAIGAVVGALGGLAAVANDAGTSLDELQKRADDYERTTTATTTAAEEYIKAVEVLAKGGSAQELEDAQLKLAKNFEAIKGTQLEDTFEAAGTDVSTMTDELKKYTDQVRMERIAKRAAVAGKAFDIGDRLDLQTDPTTGRVTSEPEVVTEWLKQRKKVKEEFARKFGPMFKEMNIDEEFVKEMTEISKEIDTFGFAGWGASFKKELGIDESDFELMQSFQEGAREKLIELFRSRSKMFDQMSEEDMQGLFGGDFIDMIKGTQRGIGKDTSQQIDPFINWWKKFIKVTATELPPVVEDLYNTAKEAEESFIRIKSGISQFVETLSAINNALDNVNKVRKAWVSERAGLLTGAGKGVAAVGFKQQQATVQFEEKRQSAKLEFVTKNAERLAQTLRDAGAANADATLKKLREGTHLFMTDVNAGLDELSQMQTQSIKDQEKIRKTITDMRREYAARMIAIEIEKTTTESRLNVERKRAENNEREKILTGEMQRMLGQRARLAQERDTGLAMGIAGLRETYLNDPRAFRGRTTTGRLQGRQAVESQIARMEFEQRKSADLEENVRKVAEMQVQKDVIDSNVALVHANSALWQKLDELIFTLNKEEKASALQGELGTRMDAMAQSLGFKDTAMMDQYAKYGYKFEAERREVKEKLAADVAGVRG